MAFDTLGAMQKLRTRGAEEALAEGVVEVVADATADLVTREYLDARLSAERGHVDARFEALRGELYRALAIQGGVILGGMGVILALLETLN